jgi:hypothetical protein
MVAINQTVLSCFCCGHKENYDWWLNYWLGGYMCRVSPAICTMVSPSPDLLCTFACYKFVYNNISVVYIVRSILVYLPLFTLSRHNIVYRWGKQSIAICQFFGQPRPLFDLYQTSPISRISTFVFPFYRIFCVKLPCEQAVSQMKIITSRYRSRLNDENLK